MIAPKLPKPTRAEEKAAYLAATIRDEGRCVFCYKVGTVERDHRQNRQAGNTVAENIQCLCPAHHQWKTSHPADAEREGYTVPRWGDPAEWPARRMVMGNYGPDTIWCLYLPINAEGVANWVEIPAHEAKRRMSGDGKVF